MDGGNLLHEQIQEFHTALPRPVLRNEGMSLESHKTKGPITNDCQSTLLWSSKHEYKVGVTAPSVTVIIVENVMSDQNESSEQR